MLAQREVEAQSVRREIDVAPGAGAQRRAGAGSPRPDLRKRQRSIDFWFCEPLTAAMDCWTAAFSSVTVRLA